jgi:hypothetical protein
MQPMPGAVPVTTEGSEWQRMLEKDTSVMTYRAWRHHLPVRARPHAIRHYGASGTCCARLAQRPALGAHRRAARARRAVASHPVGASRVPRSRQLGHAT